MPTYSRFGVNAANDPTNYTWFNEQLFLAKANGAGWVRVRFSPDRSVTTLNNIVSAADAQGLQVLPLLMNTDKCVPWPGYTDTTANNSLGQPRLALGDWMNWVKGMASLFGFASGRPRPLVIWEVWNEPNLSTNWRAGNSNAAEHSVNSDDYAALFAKTAQALRSANSNHQVMHAATSPGPSSDDGGKSKEWQYSYMRGTTIALRNSDVDVDAFALHPYAKFKDAASTGIDGSALAAMNNYYEYTSTLPQAGYGGPIWVTEFGWNSMYRTNSDIPPSKYWSVGGGQEGQQSRYDDLLSFLVGKAACIMCYTIRDFYVVDNQPDVWERHMGIYQTDNTPKAAAATFRSYAQSSGSFTL